jgi:hypothetical protein
MPTRSTDRRPLGTARFDPAIPVLRQTGGRPLPDVHQPVHTARRTGR